MLHRAISPGPHPARTHFAVGNCLPATPAVGLAMGSAWLLGVGVQLQQAACVSGSWLGLGALAALVCAAAAVWAVRQAHPNPGGARRGGAWLWVCAALVLSAWASTEWRAQQRLADALAPELEMQTLVVEGLVDEMPQRDERSVRWIFAVDRAWLLGAASHHLAAARPGLELHGHDPQAPEVQLPARISLAWYADRASSPQETPALSPQQLSLRAGERWRFTVRLKRPHGLANPHGFDLERWLFERGVRATGSVRAGADSAQRLAAAPTWHVHRLRQHLRDALFERVPDRRAAGVLAALSVGDQGAIKRADWAVFRDTGVAHLVSISGLHVTMFAWAAAWFVAHAWRLFPRAMLWVPAPVAGRWGGVMLALAYAYFSGWGVPSQRTVWMLLTVACIQSSGRRWPWPLVLMAAALAVTVLDPWALLQSGFWLSFVAVALLMASGAESLETGITADRPVRPASRGGRAEPAEDLRSGLPPVWRPWLHRVQGWVRDGLRSQFIATLGLAPLTIVFFQQISLVGLVANWVSIPWVTLVVTPLALAGVFCPPLWDAGAWAVQVWLAGLTELSAWPWAVWWLAAVPAWAQALGLLAGALLIAPLPVPIRLAGLPLLLPLLAPAPDRPALGEFELVAADVGQGTAVIVRTRRHTLLFDAGPTYGLGPEAADAGDRVLVPLLRAMGDAELDRLVLSHRDLDHVGGAPSLLAALRVRSVWGSLEPEHPAFATAAAQGAAVQHCQVGQRWEWDGVAFTVLHPQGETDTDTDPAAVGSNAVSCVLSVTSSSAKRALLTGDAEQTAEAALLQGQAQALRSEVLLAPHHGSKTSSSLPFLQAVAPRVAVVQAGYRNRYGHPAPSVMQRYAALGIPVVQSAHCGAWHWSSADRMVPNVAIAPNAPNASNPPSSPKAPDIDPEADAPRSLDTNHLSTADAATADPLDVAVDSPPAAPGECWRETQRRYWHWRP